MSPKLIKLKLQAERAEREAKAAQEAYEQKWLLYVNTAKDAGFCAVCEKKLSDCRCVVMATCNPKT